MTQRLTGISSSGCSVLLCQSLHGIFAIPWVVNVSHLENWKEQKLFWGKISTSVFNLQARLSCLLHQLGMAGEQLSFSSTFRRDEACEIRWVNVVWIGMTSDSITLLLNTFSQSLTGCPMHIVPSSKLFYCMWGNKARWSRKVTYYWAWREFTLQTLLKNAIRLK